MKLKINWKYALGEILIVIIGISIAFALNKWSESRKKKNDKRQYLASLLADVKSESAGLAEDTLAFNAKLGTVSTLLSTLRMGSERLDTLRNRFFSLPQVISFEANDITYRTMVGSGNANLLANFELIKDLEEHYSNHKQIEMAYDRQNAISENYFGPLLIYKMDYSKLARGDYSILQERETQNIIQSLNGTYYIALSAAKEGIRDCENLSASLEEELDQL